jgi:hypothetical protein
MKKLSKIQRLKMKLELIFWRAKWGLADALIRHSPERIAQFKNPAGIRFALLLDDGSDGDIEQRAIDLVIEDWPKRVKSGGYEEFNKGLGVMQGAMGILEVTEKTPAGRYARTFRVHFVEELKEKESHPVAYPSARNEIPALQRT